MKHVKKYSEFYFLETTHSHAKYNKANSNNTKNFRKKITTIINTIWNSNFFILNI